MAKLDIITIPSKQGKLVFNVPFELIFKINKTKMLFKNLKILEKHFLVYFVRKA
ncbi:restriction endonuclease [Pediococcus acidilactici]|nr:restriction endonuclease [Pediococcus acidilactici]